MEDLLVAILGLCFLPKALLPVSYLHFLGSGGF